MERPLSLLMYNSTNVVYNANRDGHHRARTCKGKVVRRGSALCANSGQSAKTE